MNSKSILFRNLLVLLLCLTFVGGLFAQERSGRTENLEFTRIKPTDAGFTVYFNVSGLKDEAHAEAILQELLNDPGVYDGSFFESVDGQDRFHIYIYPEITAEYIRSIIKNHGIDYNFSTVSINGRLPNRDKGVSVSSMKSETIPVNMEGFPQYINTGNAEEDAENYRVKKQKWIDENPEKYEKMLEELKR